MKKLSYWYFISLWLLLLGCKSKENITHLPISFTYSPIALNQIDYLLALGWIQPVGHTLPTDHVYFWSKITTETQKTIVYAPASGTISKILLVPIEGINECKIWIQMTDAFTYYLDHIVLDATLKEGDKLQAGQIIGTIGLGRSIDLGAIDNTIIQKFARPERYVFQTLNCGYPFTYFTDTLKSKLYALVDREGGDKDGWVNVDIKGRLSGNWFLEEDVFYTDGNDYAWQRELSFAYDIQHPSERIFAEGGTLGMVGKWYLLSEAISPTEVSVASGKVIYTLWSCDPNALINTSGCQQRGALLLQMIDDTTIKIEAFPNVIDTSTLEFVNPKIYIR